MDASIRFRAAAFAPAVLRDADELAGSMRRADRVEIALMHGFTPAEAARLSIDMSDASFSARVNGRLHCIFGARTESVMDSSAVAWMLCTDEPEKNPRAFIANCRKGFRLLADRLPAADLFTNIVHAENAVAVRWLEWMGAWFSPAEENVSGLRGGVFRRFSIDLNDLRKGR